MVPGDDDIDLGVIINGDTDEELVAAWQELSDLLGDHLLAPPSGERNKIHLKLQGIEPMKVDLFPAWVRNGLVYLWPAAHGTVTEEDLFPLATRQWDDQEVWVPAKPEPFWSLTTAHTGAHRTPYGDLIGQQPESYLGN
jgi:hypothetical protein